MPGNTIRLHRGLRAPPGTMSVSVALDVVSCGTDLTVVQDGIPEAIPVEMCYLGWQESLAALALLVEPDIRV